MTRIASNLIDSDLIAGRFEDIDGADGFIRIGSLLRYSGIIAVPTVAYTLRKFDAGKLIQTTSGSATSITVPPAALVSFEPLSQIHILQWGAGQVTIVEGDGVSVETPETLKSSKQYAIMTLLAIDTNSWLLTGYLEAAA
jgi:hypothetical protein